VFVGADDDLDAVAQLQLAEQAADVGLYGSLGEYELGGDLSVGQASGDLDKNLAFPGPAGAAGTR
jgi:hypothetical protein